MSDRLSRIGSMLFDWLAPRDCLGCSTEIGTACGWCPACAAELEANSVSQLGDCALFAPYLHVGPARRAVHHLKYSGRSDYARRLVMTAFPTERPRMLDQAALIPVPLHPLRLVERGYNQAALLARPLASRWRLEIAFGLLVREASTGSQVGRGRVERAENVRGAFGVRSVRARPRRAWLVDDVVTTGATARGCRDALERAGITLAGIIALCHAIPPCSANS